MLKTSSFLRSLLRLTGLVLMLAASPAAAELTPEVALADYHHLREGLYATAPVPIPEGGLRFQRDTASWTLEAGELRGAAPTSTGRVTGLVFTGSGRFRLAVPDPVERAQLRRSAGVPDLEGVDVAFTRMVLRTSEDLLAAWLPDAGGGPHAVDETAAERHRNWLVRRWFDVDARILQGLLTPGDEYLRAEMETDAFGWLTYEFDGTLEEESRLIKYQRGTSYAETWVSLDRGEDRDPRGRPAALYHPLMDLEHADIRADLTAAARTGRHGYGDIQPRHGRFAVELVFQPLVDGPRALPLQLTPWAEVTDVHTADGRSLPFLRDPIGTRDRSFDNDLQDDDLVVLLGRPLAAGEERRLTIVYELDVYNYMPGRSWYPGSRDGFRDLHTARIHLTVRPKHEVRAMGRLVADEEGEGRVRELEWEVAEPTKMVTFSFAERFTEDSIAQEGLPEVVAFATSGGRTMRNKVFNVAADISNSLKFYQWLFDDPLDVDRLYVTAIIGGHGQAFDGFLHLAERTFEVESRGPTELFRAHEAAHQWWGHRVGWASYRDQWLSEAFAEYSAMMFIEATFDEGHEEYLEIVGAYMGEVLGVTEASPYGNYFQSNDTLRRRIGPISVGYRAATAESRSGYFTQTYVKGAVVLHMLRTLLRNATKSDELFIAVLREFVARHRGGSASTDDFVAALSRRAPGEWEWFFDQWVHATAVPTYTWDWEASPRRGGDGGATLTLDVEQSGVPAGFRMPVPVQLEFRGSETGQVVVLVDKPRESFEIQLPAPPKKVVFNPDHAVLARVKKR